MSGRPYGSSTNNQSFATSVIRVVGEHLGELIQDILRHRIGCLVLLHLCDSGCLEPCLIHIHVVAGRYSLYLCQQRAMCAEIKVADVVRLCVSKHRRAGVGEHSACVTYVNARNSCVFNTRRIYRYPIYRDVDTS
jgi:hypothetical protein